jgi:hypothetical protein
MRPATQWQPLGTILAGIVTVALLLTLGTTARAGDFSDRKELRIQRPGEISNEVESSDSHVSWLQTHIHIRKKRGIEYSHPFTMGKSRLLFNIHGPMMSRKRLGLGFELRFAARR